MYLSFLYRRLFIIAPVLIGLSILLQVLLPAESDKGWLLHAARMWLTGDRLYVNIIEINPPLIIWLYSLPVWVAMHVHYLRDYEVLGAMGLAAAALSVWTSTKVMRFHPAFAGNTVRQEEFILLLFSIFIFFTTQGYFFDREHIFLMFSFPYMLRFMPSLADVKFPRALRILVACMAAFGCCIKPHTLIVFGILQLFMIIRKRSFAAVFHLENYIVGTVFLTYLCLIRVFHPEYYYDIIPMAAATYGDFGNRGTNSIYLPPVFIAIAMMFADFRPWFVTPFRRDTYYFLGVCLAFVAYAISNQGWGYTYNPIYSILMFVAVWMLWNYDWLGREFEQSGMSTRNIRFGIRSCVLVIAVHAIYMVVYISLMGFHIPNLRSSCEWGNDECIRKPYIQYLTNHNIRTFGTISYDFNNWVAIVHLTDIQWNTRFNHLWMMPDMIFKPDAFKAAHHWILEFVAKGLAADMNTKKPEAMFVDESTGFMGKLQPVTLPDLLSTVPEFKEAWSHYRFTTIFDTCRTHMAANLATECRYVLYSRIPEK